MILHNIKKANDISDFHQNYLYVNPQPGFLRIRRLIEGTYHVHS